MAKPISRIDFPYPTTHHKDRLFHSRITRPVTLKVSNAMMEACFSLLTATKQWPEIDTEVLCVARRKATEAFVFWRRTHGGPGTGGNSKPRKRKKKEKANVRGPVEPTPVDPTDSGSLPRDFAGKDWQRS